MEQSKQVQFKTFVQRIRLSIQNFTQSRRVVGLTWFDNPTQEKFCLLSPDREHTNIQATQQGCLPSLLGDGNKGIEIMYGEEKIFFSGPTRASKAEQKSLVPTKQA